jgi:hypothetical protein
MSRGGEHRRAPRWPYGWIAAAVSLAVISGLSAWLIPRRHTTAIAERGPASPPARSPASSPSPSPSAPAATKHPASPPRGRLVIHGAGDVNVDPGYIPNLDVHGYAWAWTGLNGLFKRDDLTVVNLECAISNLGTGAQDVQLPVRP